MKYQLPDERIPQDKRRSINDKILILLASKQMGEFSAQDIFSAYTGDGGLHGLDRNDFNSYHDFSKAKQEIENGQFYTPPLVCEQIVKCLHIGPHDLVADLCCGSGNFINALPVEANVYGCELDTKSHQVATFLFPEAQLSNGDMRFFSPTVRFDFIVGNPPFNINLSFDGSTKKSQDVYLMRCADLLRPAGIAAFIVPSSFAADDFIDKSKIEFIDEHFNFLGQAPLKDNTFSSLGVAKFSTKVLFLQKKFEGMEDKAFDVSSSVNFIPDLIYRELIAPALVIKESLRNKITLKTNSESNPNDWSFSNERLRIVDGFEFQLKKLFFEVKTHPVLRPLRGKVQTLVDELQNQKRPEAVSQADWEKQKLTPGKVLSRVRKMVKEVYCPKKTGIHVYRDQAGIHVRANDPLSGKYLNEVKAKRDLFYHDIIASPDIFYNHPFFQDMKMFATGVNKRIEKFKVQNTPFTAQAENKAVDAFLSDFSFINKKGKQCHFNDIQREDLSQMLQKKLGLLNWEQGSGKTAGAFAFLQWNQKSNPSSITFIVGPPNSIRETWKSFFEFQKLPCVTVERNADISSITPGSVVLLPLSKLNSLKRELKTFLKGKHKNLTVVFDEFDEISNFASARARMMMNIFRKAPRKLLTTGTPTRNNLSEFYSVVAFLFNHSYMCIDECQNIYRENRDKDTGEKYVVDLPNDNQGNPFPAYGGWSHFKSCFSPSRKTVFGIGKHNQDVYNAKALESVLNCTVITRKFSEIAGEGKFRIDTKMVKMDAWEIEVRDKLMTEFSSVVHTYYASTGNGRKDAMLKIIRQLKALIGSCSRPQKYYHTAMVPTKLIQIVGMINNMNERVMLGCTTIASAAMYAEALRAKFPDRKVWMVTGKDFTVAQRQAAIDEFEKTTDGIMVSTQMALASSLNIGFVDQVIIESLQWNYPRVSQYMMRAIRFDSERPTKVHFVIYEDSIEVNILMLMLEKERLNDFLKTKTLRNTKEIMTDFNVGEWLLTMVTQKVKDDKGAVRLVAGNQKMVA